MVSPSDRTQCLLLPIVLWMKIFEMGVCHAHKCISGPWARDFLKEILSDGHTDRFLSLTPKKALQLSLPETKGQPF